MAVTRRDFLAGVTATVGGGLLGGGNAVSAQSPSAAIPIIDAHIHLFDPTRPQGAPYSGPKTDEPPVPTYPERYLKLAVPL